MKSNGSTCAGGCVKASVCCRETIVPITDADVRRIMKATGLPAEKIVRLYSSADLDYDGCQSWIRFPYGKRVMGLKKRGNDCKFLDQHGLCTVYEHRPITCRTYPYMVHFHDNGRLKSLDLNTDVDCCGRLGQGWPRTKLLADARREDDEDDVYLGKLRRFEKRGAKGGKRGLLKFLGLA